jgi:glutathione S-transferase
MKLYYSPGACSLSPHIVAREAGIDLTLDKVDFATKTTASGGNFLAINPKGYVPALQLDNGEILTEGPAIVQYLADSRPQAGLLPASGTLQRYRILEWLAYINSELHKSFGPLFNPATTPEGRTERIAYLRRRYTMVESALADRSWLGEQFSVADAYLFAVTNWAGTVKLDLSAFPNLLAFQQRVAARASVRAAMVAEGLIAA